MPTGLFNTDPARVPANLVANSFASAIAHLMPNGEATLFAMTSMLSTETAVQIEHGFFTKTMVFPSVTLNGSVTSSDTTITVVTTENMIPGMLLRFEDAAAYEIVIVNNVISTTQLQVQRGLGGVSAASHSDATKAYQVGSAHEEGSARPNALNIKAVRITNLTHIFRDSWAVTDTMRATMMIAGANNVADSRKECMTFHACNIERGIIFSQKSQGTRNGQPFRTMDGFISIVGNLAYYPSSYSAANVFVAGSTTNYTQLEAMIDPCFNQTTDPKTANERLILTGSTGKKVLTKIGRLSGQYQIMDGQNSYGLQFGTFKVSRGTCRIVEHPMLNSNPTWAQMALVVDMSTFNLAYLGNRKTMPEEAMAPDNDGHDSEVGSLTTEMTITIKNPPANAVIYNLTDGAAG